MKLYIIGNGFDLEHGLPARYSDFASFCKINDPNLFELINNTFPNITTDSLWSNFEEGLGTPNPFAIKSCYNLFGDKSIQDYSLNLKSFLNEAFKDWVISIKRLTPFLKKHYIFNDDSLFLSFNYTDVLETLYGIKSKILHIHDFVNKEDEELFAGYIYGHGGNKLDEDSDINVFINDFSKSYKEDDLKEFINLIPKNEYNKLEIIVIGHSMNPVDDNYLRIINERFLESKWHIFYFDHNDYYSKLKNISRLHIKYFELLRS
jgi:hypothetical protein